MSFKLDSKKLYTMPVSFGPMVKEYMKHPATMENIEGEIYQINDLMNVTNHTLVYESNPSQLEKLLPEKFTLDKPYVIVNHRMNRNVAWLGGKGYNLISLTVPATYHGKKESVKGCFMVAIWENKFEPIMAGREALGYCKTFADIEDVTTYKNTSKTYASNWGFQFLSMKLDITKAPDNIEEIKSILFEPDNQGDMNYKYIPKTGNGFAGADADCITLLPRKITYPDNIVDVPDPVITYGTGYLQWNRPEFQDMPTQYHIVQGLDDLEIKRFVGAAKVEYYNVGDYYNIRVIE